jgi:hypothetical protein
MPYGIVGGYQRFGWTCRSGRWKTSNIRQNFTSNTSPEIVYLHQQIIFCCESGKRKRTVSVTKDDWCWLVLNLTAWQILANWPSCSFIEHTNKSVLLISSSYITWHRINKAVDKRNEQYKYCTSYRQIQHIAGYSILCSWSIRILQTPRCLSIVTN